MPTERPDALSTKVETVPLCACCQRPYRYRWPKDDPWDGRLDAYCDDCASARCDAYPGDCGKTRVSRSNKAEAS